MFGVPIPLSIIGKLKTGNSNRKGRRGSKGKTDVTERAIGAALATGKTTIEALSKRPGIRASVGSLKAKITTGKAEKHEIINKVYQNANNIRILLQSKGVSPNRLAIDGVPGSGKSTIARALAEKLNFEVKTLDYIDLNKPHDFSKEQAIYEHHRLLRTQDVDEFDAIIYIDEPVELSKEKCIHRKRGGINIDVFDYEKLKRIGEKAFEIADGKVFSIPDSYIKIKVRPHNGFRAYENVKEEVERKGLKIRGHSKEELLFMSVYGRPRKGLMAYVKVGAYNKEILEGLSVGVLRFLMA